MRPILQLSLDQSPTYSLAILHPSGYVDAYNDITRQWQETTHEDNAYQETAWVTICDLWDDSDSDVELSEQPASSTDSSASAGLARDPDDLDADTPDTPDTPDTSEEE